MAHATLSDHIRVFDGALGAADCARLIERFEAAPEAAPCASDTGFSFTQLDVTAHWPDAHKALVPVFLAHFNRYQRDVQGIFWPPAFSFEHIRLKRYLPNGRDQFALHVDVMGREAARRFMTAFIYLNAPDGGGETVFPTLGLSVAPEPGKLIAFPPLWMFPHAGQPPKASPKYILHTYLCYPEQAQAA